MSGFKAKMYWTQFRLGALPQTPLGVLTALPRPYSFIWGPTSNGREEVGHGRVEGEREGKGREWEGTKEEGTQGLVHTPMSKILKKILWLQNWSDWQGRQHRRLPQAANTLVPPLLIVAYTDWVTLSLGRKSL